MQSPSPDELLVDTDDASPDEALGGPLTRKRGAIVGDLGAGGLGLDQQLLLASDRKQALEEEAAVFAAQADSINSRFHVLRKGNAKATVSEVKEMRDYLVKEILDAKIEILGTLQGYIERASADMEALRQGMAEDQARNQEARQKLALEARSQLTESSSRIQQEINMVSALLEEKLVIGFQEVERRFGDALNRELQLRAYVQNVETKLVVTRAELSANAAMRWTTTNALFQQQEENVDRAIEGLYRDMRAKVAESVSLAENRLKNISDEVFARFSDVEGSQAGTATDIKSLLQSNFASLSKRADALEEHSSRHQAAVDSSFGELKRRTENQLSTISALTRRLKFACASMENIPTRRVEWLVRNASRELRQPFHTSGSASWFSPKFEAAGTSDLRLELRLPGVGGAASMTPGSDYRILTGRDLTSSPGSPGSVTPSGDCGLFLWSLSKGLHLVCKLYVGDVSNEVTHTFDGQQPVGTGSLGSVWDLIDHEEDTLRIGLEIHEAIYETEQPKELDDFFGVEEDPIPPCGSIVSHRYLNHRMLDLVKQQVALMQSRMVRRVEWRIENASALRKYFPEGESMCSSSFEAAGVPGLQLVFYPSGYAGAKEGYCSVFLHCPAGSMMRCYLSAGKQRREAKVAFENQYGYFGRTNFCRFDSAVDPDDTIMLVLEIDEAQQSVTEAFMHQPPLTAQIATAERLPPTTASANPNGASPPPALLNGVGPAGAAWPVDKIAGSMKLKKTPATATLEDVRQLPSIWTSRPASDVKRALEGFHSFNEFKPGSAAAPNTARKPHSARGRAPNGDNAGNTLRYAMYA